MRTSQKHGQKASLVRYTKLALVMYVGVLALLFLWKPEGAAFRLSLGPVNLYTILFVLFFGIGYGAYYATADMPIPMVADCSDYETYRSGNYIPGIMGTLFSLVDKLVSSLGSTIVGVALALIGIHVLPDGNTPYSEGMHGVVMVLFCVIPMTAWGRNADRHERIHADGREDERDSGNERQKKGRNRRGADAGRGNGKVAVTCLPASAGRQEPERAATALL